MENMPYQSEEKVEIVDKTYLVFVNGEETRTSVPGGYAGWRRGKIFGTLDCASGKRMKSESRIFFAGMRDAIEAGYRPCKNCKPMTEEDFEAFASIIGAQTLKEFYSQ